MYLAQGPQPLMPVRLKPTAPWSQVQHTTTEPLRSLKEAMKICLIQDFEADFLWKVSLKILNSGIILKTFTHALPETEQW